MDIRNIHAISALTNKGANITALMALRQALENNANTDIVF
jgi:hypothetical protein